MPPALHPGPSLALLALALQPACSLSYLPLGASDDGGCPDVAFVRPAVVNEVSLVDADDWAPAVSADERVMVFASWRPGGPGGSDLWIAARSAVDQPFSAPEPIADLNTPAFESGPSLNADGLTICFESDRPGSAGMADLYIATRPDRASPFGPAVAGGGQQRRLGRQLQPGRRGAVDDRFLEDQLAASDDPELVFRHREGPVVQRRAVGPASAASADGWSIAPIGGSSRE
jgi:hypothetical protein